ncbi:hypothetical protein SAMN05421812_1322 [Asanoa hainanensis]|uniref:Uncharacterized protein n=1 Tax=Asanoa hainanensis TaxID=560556 RepID=A0A239PH01_9ACTN|nr:hypothetical protein SAMN05421812_1322 [Asanoa hainanensis]
MGTLPNTRAKTRPLTPRCSAGATQRRSPRQRHPQILVTLDHPSDRGRGVGVKGGHRPDSPPEAARAGSRWWRGTEGGLHGPGRIGTAHRPSRNSPPETARPGSRPWRRTEGSLHGPRRAGTAHRPSRNSPPETARPGSRPWRRTEGSLHGPRRAGTAHRPSRNSSPETGRPGSRPWRRTEGSLHGLGRAGTAHSPTRNSNGDQSRPGITRGSAQSRDQSRPEPTATHRPSPRPRAATKAGPEPTARPRTRPRTQRPTRAGPPPAAARSGSGARPSPRGFGCATRRPGAFGCHGWCLRPRTSACG